MLVKNLLTDKQKLSASCPGPGRSLDIVNWAAEIRHLLEPPPDRASFRVCRDGEWRCCAVNQDTPLPST